MATGLERAVRGSLGLISYSRSGEPVYPTRPWYEDPEWINESCEGLQFHEMFRYRFKKSGHINVNEVRTYKSLIKLQLKPK